MSKHTPGEWKVEKGEQPGFWDIIHNPGPKGIWICDTDDEDNANLIASAPDLLKALEAVEWVQDLNGVPVCASCYRVKPDFGMWPEGHTADCQLAQALKKARGE